jgi:hypothetical protein
MMNKSIPNLAIPSFVSVWGLSVIELKYPIQLVTIKNMLKVMQGHFQAQHMLKVY